MSGKGVFVSVQRLSPHRPWLLETLCLQARALMTYQGRCPRSQSQRCLASPAAGLMDVAMKALTSQASPGVVGPHLRARHLLPQALHRLVNGGGAAAADDHAVASAQHLARKRLPQPAAAPCDDHVQGLIGLSPHVALRKALHSSEGRANGGTRGYRANRRNACSHTTPQL